MEKRLIVFVCTGNMCRSPMAEYLLRRRLRRLSGWEVCSAGTAASQGFAPSYGAVAVLNELGIDLQPHRSQPVTEALMRRAEVVVVMTTVQREQLREMFPFAADNIYLLKSFDLTASGWDIDDPIGLSVDVYRGIRDEIQAALPGLISFLERHELPESIQEGGWASPLDDEDEDET